MNQATQFKNYGHSPEQHSGVGIDYFLFSCLEHERTMRANGNDGQDGRWPLLHGMTAAQLSPEFESQDLSHLLTRMCLWYLAQYPELGEEGPLGNEQLNLVVGPFIRMTLDLTDLVVLKTGSSLTEQNEATQATWEDIRRVLKEEFSGYHQYFLRFLDWAFNDVPPVEIEPGSRPPVGRFLPPLNRSSGGTHRQQGNGGGGPRSHHSRSSGSPGNSRGEPRDYGRRPSRDNRRPSYGNGAPRNEFDQSQKNEALEKTALESVDEAIKTLEEQADINEVFLKPMNSFYRRLQHQYAVDRGYLSTSVGDGQDRGVMVSRKTADGKNE